MEGIKFFNGTFGYRHIPKVACTSIKEELYRIEFGFEYSNTNHKTHIHNYFNSKLCNIKDCKDRVIVLRDPIKRLLSAFSNRVTYHKELSREYVKKVNPNLINQLSIFNPGLGQFLDYFETYQKVPSIHWHVRPISTFCEALTSYTDIYKIESINELEEKISKRTNKKCKFKKTQTGGKKYSLKDLSHSQIEMLLEYYKEDYYFLKDYYRIDDIWNLWKKD